MTEPLRASDPDIWIMATTPEDSQEYQAALKRCVKRLADWIDEQALAYALAKIDPFYRQSGAGPQNRTEP
jgi:hypothetical protein